MENVSVQAQNTPEASSSAAVPANPFVASPNVNGNQQNIALPMIFAEVKTIVLDAENEYKKYDVYKADKCLEIGKKYAQMTQKDRDFSYFRESDVITQKDIIAAIALSKIDGIDNIKDIGWQKLRRVHLYQANIKNFTLNDAKIENLLDENSFQCFIIRKLFDSNHIKMDSKDIKKFVDNGLTADVFKKYNLSELYKSKNTKKTLFNIIHKISNSIMKSNKNKFNFGDIQKNIIKMDKIYNNLIKYSKKIFLECKKSNNINESGQHLINFLKMLDEATIDDLLFNLSRIFNFIRIVNNGEYNKAPIYPNEEKDIAEVIDDLLKNPYIEILEKKEL